MGIAGVTLLGFGAVMIWAGWTGGLGAGTPWTAMGLVVGILHIGAGVGALKGRLPWGYSGGALLFLSCLFLAYRFLATELLWPSGALLMAGFFALFLVLLGVFLGIAKASGALR